MIQLPFNLSLNHPPTLLMLTTWATCLKSGFSRITHIIPGSGTWVSYCCLDMFGKWYVKGTQGEQ